MEQGRKVKGREQGEEGDRVQVDAVAEEAGQDQAGIVFARVAASDRHMKRECRATKNNVPSAELL
jgi:hypothetical protein